ncbi:MAG: hypothetical protein AABX51_09020 [Nanoarchaeota archaeon]
MKIHPEIANILLGGTETTAEFERIVGKEVTLRRFGISTHIGIQDAFEYSGTTPTGVQVLHYEIINEPSSNPLDLLRASQILAEGKRLTEIGKTVTYGSLYPHI